MLGSVKWAATQEWFMQGVRKGGNTRVVCARECEVGGNTRAVYAREYEVGGNTRVVYAGSAKGWQHKSSVCRGV